MRVLILKDQFSITCELWSGRLAEEPLFSRVEWEETLRMKVKVLSSVLVLLLLFYYIFVAVHVFVLIQS